ncbi:transglutaminase [Cyanobacterium stanieri LEGE 03274]|uniref:Transglutaminase n=1 Tax=Cyanobacterium stanieri LEGE 03274 TaxID=1828756 RepID=A0ABR9V3I0_9CHRO|nr:transglutaminase domain-containing protein [Cyanobacterium stanieri]MBE9221359.1 transglutaminase [Cyanobacterium stanieri LEGE 03274]
MRNKHNYNRRSRKRKQKRGKKKSRFFPLLILVGFLVFNHYANPQWRSPLEDKLTYENIISFINSFNFRITSLKSLTQEFITEFNEPIVIGDINTLDKTKFSDIDNKALAIQYSGNSASELANMLSQYATTDVEKARIIYSWITHNIAYDVVALNTFMNYNIYPDVTVKSVLDNRQTICSGYANLYQQLAQNMGLKSVIVIGYAKGVDYAVGNDNNVNHAWNGVQIDGKWYILDPTWGAGIINNDRFEKGFNDFYFATAPQNFIYTHFPENNKWQLLNTPYTRNNFDNLPTVSHHFFSNNFELVTHKNKNIIADNVVNITLKAPQNIVAITSLQSNDQEIEGQHTFIQRQGELINIKASFPERKNYQLKIFGSTPNQENNYPFILGYDINVNRQTNQEFPFTFSHFSEHNGYLESPVQKQLNPQQNNYFKLRIDNAIDVKVFDKSSNNWTTLTRYGNLFTGNVEVSRGEVIVYARFPGDRNFWGLLRYNH